MGKREFEREIRNSISALERARKALFMAKPSIHAMGKAEIGKAQKALESLQREAQKF